MNQRRADIRTAVFQRQRSQGHLRAVTATVGIAGVVTAGAVAAILPGSTHAAASSRTRSAPAPSTPARSAASATPSGAPASPAQATRHHHRHHARKASPATAAATAPAAPAPVATTAPPQSTSGGS